MNISNARVHNSVRLIKYCPTMMGLAILSRYFIWLIKIAHACGWQTEMETRDLPEYIVMKSDTIDHYRGHSLIVPGRVVIIVVAKRQFSIGLCDQLQWNTRITYFLNRYHGPCRTNHADIRSNSMKCPWKIHRCWPLRMPRNTKRHRMQCRLWDRRASLCNCMEIWKWYWAN